VIDRRRLSDNLLFINCLTFRIRCFQLFHHLTECAGNEADEDIRVQVPNDQGRSEQGRNRVLRAPR
jgi:hypothetical protein